MKSLPVALLALLLPVLASAQAPGDRPAARPGGLNLWVMPMLGVGDPVLGVGLAVNASRGSLMLAYRLHAMGEISLGAANVDLAQHQVLAGVKREGSLGHFALLSGLSFDRGAVVVRAYPKKEYPYAEQAYSGLGLPLVADAVLASPYIGIGLSAFVNYNPENTTTGLRLCLPFGYIRSPASPSR